MTEYSREIPPEIEQSINGADTTEHGVPPADVAVEVLRRMAETEPAVTTRRIESRGRLGEKSQQREVGAAVLAGGGEIILENIGESGTQLEQSRH